MPSFFRSFIVAFVILPMVWAAANSVNATQMASQILGVNIPSGFEIPGLREALQVKDLVDDEKKKAADLVRRTAVKTLKKEVRKKYGPDAAALIPNDLTLKEAKSYNFKQFEKILAKEGIAVPSVKPKPAPVAKGKAKYKKAIKTLDKIPVKGRAPKTGYARSQFGSEWSDSAGKFKWTGNGCDTRNDVLARDLTKVKRDGKCKVTGGVLEYENYTGKKNVKFDPKGDYANHLDIEHWVPLSWAWQHGAQSWTPAKRAALANDPVNLFAADPSSNRQKGDSGPGAWLPKNKSFRCDYIVGFVNVIDKYDLWINSADKAASKKILTGCK